jgi:general secretion pathway protein M
MNALASWYSSLDARERRFVSIGGIATVLALLIALIVLPVSSAASRAAERLDKKREDLGWMRSHAAEVMAAPANSPNAANEPAVVIIDRTARAAGLASALRGTQPDGNQGVHVQIEGASFDVLVAWLASVDRDFALGVNSITIDRGARPGIVNASISFAPPHS